ncbi:MAG TPA: hypothetical protein VK183_11785 [Flavobacterium sp.]|nr:hypothetical protein [Flavobacterium sp.]
MEFSFLIVTRHRVAELLLTLSKLEPFVMEGRSEVLVFIDACPETEALKSGFPWIRWSGSKTQLGASAARAQLYPQGKGKVFIGLDDDAHPVTKGFLDRVSEKFRNTAAGLLAFREIKGVFADDDACLAYAGAAGNEYLAADFIGSGFAILRDVYMTTRGFPTWIDIYGEETCVALEVLESGFEIRYVPSLVVNHRVDMAKRRASGQNYFRFERQLYNSFFIFIVYYRYPLKRILRLLFHNFRKYGLADRGYFKAYWRAVAVMIRKMPAVLRFRKPMSVDTERKIKDLAGIPY